LKTSSTPDCCHSRQNQRVRFLKPDSPVSPISNRGFQLLSNSCGNSNSARGILTLGNQRHDLPQVEYRATKEVLSLVFSLLFYSSFLYIFMLEEDDGSARAIICSHSPAVLQPRQQGNRPLHNAVKGVVYNYTPPQLLACRVLYLTGYYNRIQNGSHDCCGPARA
jgi:hypothetical protein